MTAASNSDARKRLAEQQAAPDTLADKLYAYFYSQPSVNWPERHAAAVAALVAEHYAPGEDAVAFVKRLINAWDCCGTCAGGVLAERDRAVVAAERERADAATRDALLDVLAWVVDQGADDFTRSAVAHELSHRIAALGGEATP